MRFVIRTFYLINPFKIIKFELADITLKRMKLVRNEMESKNWNCCNFTNTNVLLEFLRDYVITIKHASIIKTSSYANI